ncbi:MAG: efflux transporter outer membrane subunit [Xylophilus ampelinus]
MKMIDLPAFPSAFRPSLLAAALLLAGCAAPPPADLAALSAAPARFKEAPADGAAPAAGAPRWTEAPPAEALPRGAWWRLFGDPALDALAERAGAANTGIREAAARLARARALLRGAEAERLPQAGLGGGLVRQAGADTVNGAAPATLGRAGASLSWEPDLFGRLARVRDAAALDAAAQAALLESTRLLVQADTVQAYLALRAADEERGLVRETVEAYRGSLGLAERRFAAGEVAEIDVVRLQAELAATEADALAIDRRRALLEHALAVLAGAAASDFALPAVPGWRAALPSVPAGVPGTVLARRPDVSAAQAALLAAQARVGVAQAAWFPSVSLTGAGGFASTDLGDLFRWSARAWSLGALLSVPVFDGGRRAAGIADARARLDEATAGYRGQVLAAFREVEDQLAALRILADEAAAQARAVEAARRATALSESRWRNGLVSQIELLDARRSELRNRRAALQVQAARRQATVALVKALGGGWDAAPAQARAVPAPAPR